MRCYRGGSPRYLPQQVRGRGCSRLIGNAPQEGGPSFVGQSSPRGGRSQTAGERCTRNRICFGATPKPDIKRPINVDGMLAYARPVDATFCFFSLLLLFPRCAHTYEIMKSPGHPVCRWWPRLALAALFYLDAFCLTRPVRVLVGCQFSRGLARLTSLASCWVSCPLCDMHYVTVSVSRVFCFPSCRQPL